MLRQPEHSWPRPYIPSLATVTYLGLHWSSRLCQFSGSTSASQQTEQCPFAQQGEATVYLAQPGQRLFAAQACTSPEHMWTGAPSACSHLRTCTSPEHMWTGAPSACSHLRTCISPSGPCQQYNDPRSPLMWCSAAIRPSRPRAAWRASASTCITTSSTHNSPGQVQDVVAWHLDCPLRQHPGSTSGQLQQLGVVLLLCGIALPLWVHLQAQREAKS